jgi:hypothetical protein
MKPEVAQLLVALDKFNTAENPAIFVPSQGKTLPFNPVTVKQQKDILKSAFDTKTSVFLFIETFNRILAEACKENVPLTILDKSYLALHFKQKFFKGKSYGKKGEDLVPFDLDAHLKGLETKAIPAELIAKTITSGPLIVECVLPTLTYENAISAESRSVINELIKDKKEENIKDVVGELYIYEILKFIKTIKYTFNNEPVIIDLTQLPLKEKASVFENLPLTVNNEIIDYIKTVRIFEKPYLNAGDVSITIDPIFFNKTD